MPGGVRITLQGDKELIAKLARLAPIARAAALEATQLSVDVVRNRMVAGISSPPKTGRLYGHHRASAPGEYPASDTGNLLRSIWAEVEDNLAGLALDPLDVQLSYTLGDVLDMTDNIDGRIGADAEYAAPLEYKPPERGGRPFATRALEESRDDIFRIFLGALSGKFSA